MDFGTTNSNIDLADLSDESLCGLSNEELIKIIKQLVIENKQLRDLAGEKKKSAEESGVGTMGGSGSGSGTAGAIVGGGGGGGKVEFGSFGSSNVMFLKSETDAEIQHHKTENRNQDLHNNRESGLSFGSQIDHRNLFKKSVILEYEVDSPAFRKKIEIMDKTVEDLRAHLQLLVDRCRQYCQNGNTFVESGKAFASLMSALREPEWSNCLGDGLSEFLASFGNTFEMIESYREAVILSLETTFSAPMEEFVKLEAKAKVSHLSESYESSLAKFLSLKSSVDDEIIQKKEAEIDAIQKELELSRYDLVSELNTLETKKKFQLCERTCAALYTYLSFFSQCYQMVATMEPAMIKLNSEMSLARNNFRRETILRDAKRIQLKNELEKIKMRGKHKSRIVAAASKTQTKMRHSFHLFASSYAGSGGSSSPVSLARASGNPSTLRSQTTMEEIDEFDNGMEVVKAGYLWKKANNMMKDWKRRWFFIQNGKLYYSRTENLVDSPPVFVCDLLISTVRENIQSDMRFTFEVISPGQRIYSLQGESEGDTKDWILAIRDQIEKQLTLQSLVNNHTDDDDNDMTLKVEDIDGLSKVNDSCAECGAPSPSCGIHRSLGTHISKVRSLSLDKWNSNNIELLLRIGNIRANEIWEEMLLNSDASSSSSGGSAIAKIDSHANREAREKFIDAKYIKRQFIRPTITEEDANQLLYQASMKGELVDIIRALAYGADVNKKNELDGYKSALHLACQEGHMLAVELLCQWNADVSLVDAFGKTPLDYASDEGDGGTIIESLVRKLERDLDYQRSSFVGDQHLTVIVDEDCDHGRKGF